MDVAHACVDAKSGKVKIPGFYQDVVEPTKAEIKSFLASGFQVKNFKQAYGFQTLRTNDPAEIMRRIWAAPTFEVHGLTGGYHGPGVKTVVPGHGELKVSMRLVPNQTPEKVFALLKKYVAKLNPNVKVEREGMLHPFKGSFDGPYVEVVKRAVKAGFGKEPAFVREGGSIGAVVTMQKAWKVPILFMGLSLPEHGYHAPNEYFDWGQASGGMKAFAHYFAEVAKMGEVGSRRTIFLARRTRTMGMCSFDARSERQSGDSLERKVVDECEKETESLRWTRAVEDHSAPIPERERASLEGVIYFVRRAQSRIDRGNP